MDITPLIRSDQKVVQGYRKGTFKISGLHFDHPVFVFPDEVLSWDIDGSFSALDEKDFQPLIDRAESLDVVLLGAGKTVQMLPPRLRQALGEHGLSVEVMDTGAACRTYNVLMADGRRVVAALLP